MSSDKTTEKHPSYGMISFSRVSGAGRLFGSPLAQHFGTIRVRIGNGVRVHDHGNDYYRSDGDIIEIELSASQFAEAITCMNIGDGVPCTLRWMRGDGRVEDVPHDEQSEMHRAKSAFKAKMANVVDAVQKRGQAIAELLKKDRLGKDDRAKIGEIIDYVVREVAINAPWWVEQYNEATEKVSAKAKAEIAAMFEHAIRAAGMERIVALREGVERLPELPAHDA